MRYAAIPVLFAGVAVMGCTFAVRPNASTRSDYMSVSSICALVGRAVSSDGLKVRLKSIYLTDYVERSSFADKACPTVEVALYNDAHSGDNGSLAKITHTIALDYARDHRTGVYEIELVGRYVYRNDEFPHAAIFADRILSFKQLPCTAFYSAAKCRKMD